jgi:hypothetical protein
MDTDLKKVALALLIIMNAPVKEGQQLLDSIGEYDSIYVGTLVSRAQFYRTLSELTQAGSEMLTPNLDKQDEYNKIKNALEDLTLKGQLYDKIITLLVGDNTAMYSQIALIMAKYIEQPNVLIQELGLVVGTSFAPDVMLHVNEAIASCPSHLLVCYKFQLFPYTGIPLFSTRR